jgi:hypothetical protein
VNVMSAPRTNGGFDADPESATVASPCALAPAPESAPPSELPPEPDVDPEFPPELEAEPTPDPELELVPDPEPDPELALASSPDPRVPVVDDEPHEAPTQTATPSARACEKEKRRSIRTRVTSGAPNESSSVGACAANSFCQGRWPPERAV